MTLSTSLLAASALAFVVALILLLQRAVKSGALPGVAAVDMKHIRVLQVVALDNRRRLHFCSCNGRNVLVLTGGTTDVVVDWTDERAAS